MGGMLTHPKWQTAPEHPPKFATACQLSPRQNRDVSATFHLVWSVSATPRRGVATSQRFGNVSATIFVSATVIFRLRDDFHRDNLWQTAPERGRWVNIQNTMLAP